MDHQSKLFKQIEETIHKAFWDGLESDLSKNPPNHKHVIILLNELNLMLKNLIPNRIDIHKDIDEHIDVKFVEQMIINNVFDHKELLKLITFVVNLIKKLQCFAEDKDTEMWFEKMIKMCNEKNEMKDIIILFFKRSYEKIERIKKGVEEFKMNLKKKSE